MRQDLKENLRLAMDTLQAHKLRSFLTVLGVMIGVGVMMMVAALLVGFDRAVNDEISGFGADTAYVSRFPQGPRIGRMSREERMRKPLTLEDGESILEHCPAVQAVAVNIFQWGVLHTVRYQSEEMSPVSFRGTMPSFVDVYANAALREGRFFSDAENHHRANVVVLGFDVARVLFPAGDAVGKAVQVNGANFTVIGVLERPQGGFDDSTDTRVVIPFQSFRKMYPAAEEVGFRFQAHPGQLAAAVDQVRDLLRRRRGVGYNDPDSFSILTSEQAIEQFREIVGAIALAMFVLSSIGLLVGGVGVMNIMLVSVTERTREIGVRKAIGARRRDIVNQFLFEAITLTTLGGALGILVTSGIVALVRAATTMQAVVPLWAVGLGLGVSATVGLIFGVWPAMKAAKLDPVEALRYE
jgi:putative ABC transport system permease protein